MICKIIYECEKCGIEFKDEEECREHEKNHVGIDRLAINVIKERFISTDKYPREITVLMKDGTRRIYLNLEMTSSKKESPLKTD